MTTGPACFIMFSNGPQYTRGACYTRGCTPFVNKNKQILNAKWFQFFFMYLFTFYDVLFGIVTGNSTYITQFICCCKWINANLIYTSECNDDSIFFLFASKVYMLQYVKMFISRIYMEQHMGRRKYIVDVFCMQKRWIILFYCPHLIKITNLLQTFEYYSAYD